MRRASAIALLVALGMMLGSDADARSPPRRGKLVESRTEDGFRFDTLIYASQPRRSAKDGRLTMRITKAGRVRFHTWRYRAVCEATAKMPTSLNVRIIWPVEEERGIELPIIEGTEPSNADRTWYNVWQAVCRNDLNKLPSDP